MSSVTGVSSSSQSSLLSTLLSSLQSSQSPAAASPAATTGGSSAAYLLSLGQQQSESAVLGYNQLGKLVNQADAALAGLDQSDPFLQTGDNIPQLATKYAVNVQQLAAAQSLTSGDYPDAGQTVVGTGTLTIQLGTGDAAGNSFTASGTPVTVQVQDGTLNGIASAINSANAGVTASVVQDSSGKYQLVVTGSATGAASGFSISGIAGLTYDPTAAASSSLKLTQAAEDAQYTVNGTAQTSPSNQSAPIAPGVVADLTAVGPTTVSVPYGQQQAAAAADSLTSSFNSLLSSISALTASGGQLSADPAVASKLAQALSTVAGMTFSGGKSLADIGITTQPDGTLTVDPAKLQAAYAADPAGTNATIAQASTAIQQTLAGVQGPNGSIDAETRALVAVMCQGPSLADYLLPGATSSSTSSALSALDPTASSSSTPTLADYLSAASSTSSSDPLLAALNSTQ